MTGQTKKSKSRIVEEYLKKVNPYEPHQPIPFDLRGYASYIKANGLKGTDITTEIMEKFTEER